METEIQSLYMVLCALAGLFVGALIVGMSAVVEESSQRKRLGSDAGLRKATEETKRQIDELVSYYVDLQRYMAERIDDIPKC